MKKNKKLGFTLAETLITLTIIGVVAAMTIPTLMSKYQKQELETALKVNYSALKQAFEVSKVNGHSPTEYAVGSTTETVHNWYYTYLKPYLKIVKDCKYEAGCWHNGNEYSYYLNGERVYADSGKKGIGTTATITFQLKTGAQVSIDWYSAPVMQSRFGVPENQAIRGLGIFLDVNGDKKPNIVGKDIHALTYMPEHGFQPACQGQTQDYINQDCKKGSLGACCLQKAMRNGWQLDNEIFK